jgi:hypothetical protein
MKKHRLPTYSVISGFLTFLFTFSFLCSSAMSQAESLTVTVDIYSGRPNPTFEITDPATIGLLRERLKVLSDGSLGESERHAFNRLGYRGVLITHAGGVEGMPARIQILNGNVKVKGREDGAAQFFRGDGGLERLFLGVAKQKGLLREMLEQRAIADPDSM